MVSSKLNRLPNKLSPALKGGLFSVELGRREKRKKIVKLNLLILIHKGILNSRDNL